MYISYQMKDFKFKSSSKQLYCALLILYYIKNTEENQTLSTFLKKPKQLVPNS